MNKILTTKYTCAKNTYSLVLNHDISRMLTMNVKNEKQYLPSSIIPLFASQNLAINFNNHVLKHNDISSDTWTISQSLKSNEASLCMSLKSKQKQMCCESCMREFDMSNSELITNFFEQYIGCLVITHFYITNNKCVLDGKLWIPHT